MIGITIGGIVGLVAAYFYWRYLNNVIGHTTRNDTKAWVLVASYVNFPVFGAIGALLGRMIIG